MQVEKANNSVVVEPLGSRYKLRFDDDVTCPSYYRFEIEALSQAQSCDQVQVTVNTDGGSLATGIEVSNAIFNCQTEVEGVLRSSCHSCGSIIFLACHKHDVGLASSMLLHSGFGGNHGTPSQSIERAKSYKRQVRELFDTVYKGFLTPEEITLMVDEDKEFIFSGEEIVPRLENMYSYREGLQNNFYQEQEDLLWQENNKMVDEALEELTITKEDKEAFLRVRDLLDNQLSEEEDTTSCEEKYPEDGTIVSDEPSPDNAIHQWTEDVSVVVTQPDKDDTRVMLVCDNKFLLLEEDSVLADREGVIFFLELITDLDVSRKKSTISLSRKLSALTEDFLTKV